MNIQQKLEIRKAFKLKIYESDGIIFENLFCEVMRSKQSDFKKVKPQGSFGDRKNDGFIPSEGKYFQVYAPENPIGNPSSATKKLEKDLDGLISHWRNKHNYKINEFYFVFNDKYRGAYAEIYTTLNNLKDKYLLQECDVFLSSELEDIFMDLEEDQLANICGYYPKLEDIGFIDNSLISEVITYISEKYDGFASTQTINAPDFAEKIKFNELSHATASHLNVGAYQYGYVEDYFKENSDFSRQQARDALNKMYLEHKDNCNRIQLSGSELPVSDFIFKNIIDELTPNELPRYQKRDYERNIIAVMAFFFEACDIFEEPKIQEVFNNA